MADRHWVGGTGNWSDTAHWDEHSNGAGGDSVPTGNDDVHFDEYSFPATGQTATVGATATCKTMDWTGAQYNPSFAITVGFALYIYGSCTFITGMTHVNSNGSLLISPAIGTTANITFPSEFPHYLTFWGAGTYSLQANLPHSLGWYLQWSAGTILTNDYNMSLCRLTISGVAVKTLAPGTSIITLNGTGGGGGFTYNGSNLTITANTAVFKLTGTCVYNGGGVSLYEVQFNGTSHVVTGNNAFVNLIRNGTNTKTDSIMFAAGSTQKVTGTLSLIGYSSVNRLLVYSDTLGSQATFDVDGNWNNTANVDFMDINVSHDIDLSAITGRSGDCQGNNKAGGTITFTTAATQSFVYGGVDTKWSTVGNWGAGRVPLPQDDVTAGGTTALSLDMPRVGKNISFTGTGTATPTVAPWVFGSFEFGATALWNNVQYTYFFGRSTYTIGMRNQGFSFYINAPGGIYTLTASISTGGTNGVLRGTFDLAGYNMSAGTFTISTGATKVYLRSSTVTLMRNTNVALWVCPTTAGIIDTGTSTIVFAPSSALNAHSFEGGGQTYFNLTISGVDTFPCTIYGQNIFTGTLTVDRSQANKTLLINAGSTQTVANFVCATSGTRTLTIGSSTTTPGIIAKSGGGQVCLDYVVISYSTASPACTWFYCSHNTIGSGVTGWLPNDCTIASPLATADALAPVPTVEAPNIDTPTTIVTADAFTPALSTGTDSSPPCIAVTAGIPVPAVSGTCHIEATLATAATQSLAPTIILGCTITPPKATADVSVLTPAILFDFIIPAVELSTAAAAIPVPSVHTSCTVLADLSTADAAITVPAIIPCLIEPPQAEAGAGQAVPDLLVVALPPTPPSTCAALAPVITGTALITPPTATALAVAEIPSPVPTVLVILTGTYSDMSQEINRVFVIGVDAADLPVTAIDEADI